MPGPSQQAPKSASPQHAKQQGAGMAMVSMLLEAGSVQQLFTCGGKARNASWAIAIMRSPRCMVCMGRTMRGMCLSVELEE